jgi:hypothetical protein
LATSFGVREAALEVFFNGEFQMRGHFGVEVAIELSSEEKST